MSGHGCGSVVEDDDGDVLHVAAQGTRVFLQAFQQIPDVHRLQGDLGGQFLIAYLMPTGADQLRTFVDYWLRLQQVSGFRDRMVRHWIDGKRDTKLRPRWSILRNVLGWDSD